ncbi:MAG: hypothetical protein RLZZ244_3049 [Verrucomicrobiota bacterium]|jgi:hypothetical protein
MKTGIAATLTAALSVVFSLWFYLGNTANLKLRVQAYELQQQLDTLTPQLTQKRQQIQSQQEKLNAGSALTQRVGVAIVADIATLADKNNNPALRELLSKHGLRPGSAPQKP